MDSRAVLKTFFLTGEKPTQGQFADLIDSCFNLVDDTISISQVLGLAAALAGKATAFSGTSTQYVKGNGTYATLGGADITGALGYTPENAANKAQPNGYPSLDSSGKVPSAQLPGYVDEVQEFSTLSAFPGTGATGIIYIAQDTNYEYRWSGSAYIQLVASPGSTDAVPEGTTNLYFTAARVLATLLAGLSTGSAAAITSADNVLSAFGKLQAQINLLAPLNNPALTGNPTAPTQTAGDNSTKLATTAFVSAAVSAGGGGGGGKLSYNFFQTTL